MGNSITCAIDINNREAATLCTLETRLFEVHNC